MEKWRWLRVHKTGSCIPYEGVVRLELYTSFQADFHSIQKLIRHPHQSSSFESSVVPTFAIEWPMSHKTEPYVKSAIPDFVKLALSSPSAPFSESKFFLEIIPALRGHFVTKRCYEGCDFGKVSICLLYLIEVTISCRL